MKKPPIKKAKKNTKIEKCYRTEDGEVHDTYPEAMKHQSELGIAEELHRYYGIDLDVATSMLNDGIINKPAVRKRWKKT